jgi:hypothetical protein
LLSTTQALGEVGITFGELGDAEESSVVAR